MVCGLLNDGFPTPTCYRHPDTETLVRCSNCDRPICTRCMVQSPVGIRCPECSGRTTRQRIARLRAPGAIGMPIVTYAMIALCVLAFLLQRGSTNSAAFADGDLFGPAVHSGDWYRLLSSAFLHVSIIHIGLNMWVLWWIGPPVERLLGHLRFFGVYLACALSGSAGALLASPNVQTVGASGAIFGLMGALLVMQRHNRQLVNAVAPVVFINLAFTFAVPHISIGGHLGGLAGGAICGFVAERSDRIRDSSLRLLALPLALVAVAIVDVGLSAYASR